MPWVRDAFRSLPLLALLPSCSGTVGVSRAATDASVSEDARSGHSSDSSAETSDRPIPSGAVLIPAGMFLMGDPDTRIYGAQPVHGVHLSAFYIDRLEVSVAAYRACTACYQNLSLGNFGGNRGDYPAVWLGWREAREYCRWRGGDLPTEAQWEYAARGTDGRVYPWGNDLPGVEVCWRGDRSRPISDTCPVGSSPADRSPFGIMDMAGNVSEFVLDRCEPYQGDATSFVTDPGVLAAFGHYCARGGSAVDNTLHRATARGVEAGGIAAYRGFRCAYPAH